MYQKEPQFYEELLANALAQELLHYIQYLLPIFDRNATAITELKCYHILAQIRQVLNNETLTDTDCFERIEEIIKIFDAHSITGLNRHDFG
ncbi:MAG: hypothetical protein KH420_09835 [Clostridiales bacterium]|nr:hypothetical protein [Clostridiales bacterium]